MASIPTDTDTLFRSAKKICQNGPSCITESDRLWTLANFFEEHPNIVREMDSRSRTLLHLAAGHRSPKFCKAIIDLYVESVRSVDSRGMLPFHYAFYRGNFKTATYLLDLYPESISVTNNDGLLAIHMLCFYAHVKVTKYLFHMYPESINIPDAIGRCPLHWLVGSDCADRS